MVPTISTDSESLPDIARLCYYEDVLDGRIIPHEAPKTKWITMLHGEIVYLDGVLIFTLLSLCPFAASVQLPWQRAVSQNKVPYYIK